MSRAHFNQWPGYSSMADELMRADTLRIRQYELIEGMTHDEAFGVEQALLDRIAGINESIGQLMDLRDRAHDIVRRIERVRLRKLAEISDEEAG